MFIWLAVLLGVMFFTQWFRSGSSQNEVPYTYGNFAEDLDAGKIREVIIQPNKETPTGSASVTLDGGITKTFYATDITVIENEAREKGVEPLVRQVPQESWFMTSILPTLLVAA